MSKETKPFSIKDRIRSFGFAFQGFAHLFRSEHNAWIHLTITFIVIVFGIWLKLSMPEWISIILCIGLVFISEIFNTAIECLGDAISEEKNEKIGKAKDLAAAGALLAAIVSVLIGLTIFIPHLIPKINF
jgi:diacylglycerol kinase (ATP)